MDAKVRETCFQDSLEHLLAHLERIDLLIQAQVQLARESYEVDSAFQGLFISEQEVDELLHKAVGTPKWVKDVSSLDEIHTAVDHLATATRAREQENSERGLTLRLVDLAQLFNLSPFDVDVLLVCIAPELDLRYERLYAYLQDDVTKKRASIDLVLNLLCRSFRDKVAARGHFASFSPLVSNGLLHVWEDPSASKPSQLSQYLKVDQRITDYLLGNDELCADLLASTELITPTLTFNQLVISSGIKDRLEQMARTIAAGTEPPIFSFNGADDVGKQQAAEALCQQLDIGLLVVDAPRLFSSSEAELEESIKLVGREAMLQRAAVYWRDIDVVLPEEKMEEQARFLRAIEHWSGAVFLTSRESFGPVVPSGRQRRISVEFEIPAYDQRITLWKRVLPHSTDLGESEIERLASTFRLTAAQIEGAAITASNHAFWRTPESEQLELADLRDACLQNSNQAIAKLAQKIRPHYSWDDIVLPAEQLAQLQEVRNAVQYRPIVYQSWGFEQKLSLGKGLNILFSGPSGTGKTMAAEIVANDIGLDLYKIDLSSVVSKYIGETEKNLSRIFAEASTSNAILFFDEADALFGRRSEVKDAHDRYANIETGYLLQKMEEYDGIVILATNLQNNMDDAFVRRMAFSVSFPFPGEDDRLHIWERIWPLETPLSGDLDLGFMARQFRLAGGNIKNIGLAAAFFAVVDGRQVKMEHLIRATKRELQKMGRVCVKTEFGPYYPLVQGAS